MIHYFPLLLGGLPVLPVTFDAIRQGALLFVCLVVIAIAAVCTLICSRFGPVRTRTGGLFFAIGICITETYYFLSWYFLNPTEPEQARQGVIIATIEASGLIAIGFVAISVTIAFLERSRKP